MKNLIKIGLPLVIGVLFLAITLSILNIVMANKLQETQIPIIIDNAKMTELEELKEVLLSGDLKPEDKKNIEDKIAIVERELTKQAVYQDLDKNISVKQTAIAKETLSPMLLNTQGTRPLGLIMEPPSTGVSTDFTFSTAWVQKVDNIYVRILVGIENRDPNQGVILILTEEPFRLSMIFVLNDTGNLVIEGSDGDFLKIQAENGTVFKLNKVTYKLFYDGTGEEILGDTIFLRQGTDYPYP